jgi:integrase
MILPCLMPLASSSGPPKPRESLSNGVPAPAYSLDEAPFLHWGQNAQETDRLVNACHSFQEKLVVWVLLDTGLRVHEFCGLRREHVQWQENCLVVWGKGGWYGHKGKRRVVPLTARARRLLEVHFCTNEGIGLSKRTAQRLVKRVAKRLFGPGPAFDSPDARGSSGHCRAA